jgi:hypothetical protein
MGSDGSYPPWDPPPLAERELSPRPGLGRARLHAAGPASSGRYTHSNTTLYNSLLILHTKYTRRRHMTLTSTPRPC